MERRFLLRRHKSSFLMRYPISLKQGAGNHPLLSVSDPLQLPPAPTNADNAHKKISHTLMDAGDLPNVRPKGFEPLTF